MENKQYCGFIAIVGRPNVGKSTLMNHLIGQKVSITSRKPQTTRHKVNGILTTENKQYVFVDTPGFQKKYINPFNEALNQSVVNSLKNVDAVVFVLEAGIFSIADEEVLRLIPAGINVILAVNKSDKIKFNDELNKFSREMAKKYPFTKVVNVAAKHGTGIDKLVAALDPFLPESVFLYDTEQLTDKSSSFMASEIIREKLFRYLGEELPYNLMVEIDKFEVSSKITKVYATIIVEKDNQKGMVIGKGGGKLKKVSTDARIDMQNLFDAKVHLEVWVKVKSGFADDIKFLKQFE